MRSDLRQRMYARDQIVQELGVTLDAAGEETVLRMRVTEQQTNSMDVLHGGLIFFLADTALAYSAATSGRTVTRSASILFINPAVAGDILTARSKRVASRQRSAVFDITVTNQDGTVVAEYRGECSVRDPVPGPVAL